MISLFNKTDKTKNTKLTPEDFLIKNNVIKEGHTAYQNFSLNLSKDRQVTTVRDIVLSMVEYAEYINQAND